MNNIIINPARVAGAVLPYLLLSFARVTIHGLHLCLALEVDLILCDLVALESLVRGSCMWLGLICIVYSVFDLATK